MDAFLNSLLFNDMLFHTYLIEIWMTKMRHNKALLEQAMRHVIKMSNVVTK